MTEEVLTILKYIDYAEKHRLPYIFTLDQAMLLRSALEGQQPKPKPNNNKDCWLEVLTDMNNRRELGISRYGTPLQPHNGRNSLQDAYEEALDLVVYLKQVILEQNGS